MAGWMDGWMVGLHAMRLENDIRIMRVSLLNKLRYFFELINQSKREKRMCVVCGRQDVS